MKEQEFGLDDWIKIRMPEGELKPAPKPTPAVTTRVIGVKMGKEYEHGEWYVISLQELLARESAYRWEVDKLIYGIEDPKPKITTRVIDLD